MPLGQRPDVHAYPEKLVLRVFRVEGAPLHIPIEGTNSQKTLLIHLEVAVVLEAACDLLHRREQEPF